MSAFVVVDLGFGDAGKGLLTDYLVRRHAAKLVVRFNGGAQAGHNVVDAHGRQHTFAQFGAGTLVPGVRTHLASPVVVHPTALEVEATRLAQLGEANALDRLSVDPRCLVSTPFQQAAGRLRELLRGAGRHGSCGVGVGEAVADALAAPALAVRMGELRVGGPGLLERLEQQRQLKWRELGAAITTPATPGGPLERELALLQNAHVSARWLEHASAIARSVRLLADEDALRAVGTHDVVFEGAQGVLLDEHHGFHPFTTYSRCTPRGAREILTQTGSPQAVEVVGVLRAYAVRHGPGPLPTEDALVGERTREAHNTNGPWQGAVRKGWLDPVLLDYALRACLGVDALAVTHLDALDALDPYRRCEGYDHFGPLELPRDLRQQAQLAERLLAAVPRYAAPRSFAGLGGAGRFCDDLANTTRLPVRYGSVGPTAADVFVRPASA